MEGGRDNHISKTELLFATNTKILMWVNLSATESV